MQLPKDVRAQLVSDPTGTFSLSESEADQMRGAATKGEEALVATYQRLLEARASAYWNRASPGLRTTLAKGVPHRPIWDMRMRRHWT